MTTPALAENVRGKGRHYRDRDGNLVPSVTNVLSVLNKPALPRWSAKVVAEQAAAMKQSLPNLEDDEIVDLLKGAPWRTSTRAADRGTTIHAYLEARMRNTPLPPVAGEAALYRNAAEEWLDAWQPQVLDTELTVFGEGYAGTGDLWCVMDGAVCVVDFKTSKAIYSEAALQLAALWGAGFRADGSPAPDAEEGWVVRIGEDGFDCRQVADLEANLNVFLSLVDVWHWTHSKPYAEVD
jgi:hypothetical protein